MPEQPAGVRNKNFDEVALGYDLETAFAEAGRCLQCQNALCQTGCPVNIDIPRFIKNLREKDMASSIAVLKSKNSLPAVCGRVCPQESQCEEKCVLGRRGQPIAIGRLERFVADYAREQQLGLAPAAAAEEKNRGKVAIVGSGPAGLTVAGDLSRMGYGVTIFEALHEPGGVLMYGIPQFRLPKEIVQYEISQLKLLGVKIEVNMVIGRSYTIGELLEEEGFDAVFIGTGAGLPHFMNIPGENLNGVYSANEFLTRANLMRSYKFPFVATPLVVGKKAAVIGAGNVAVDAARTAKRLGADAVSIVYRRSEKEMPARNEEIEHAKEEGIVFHLLTYPVKIIGNDKGWATAMECVRMELGEPDASGRRSPKEIKNSNFLLDADTVIVAIGQGPNPLIPTTTKGMDANKRGNIIADENGRTTRDGVFAGGDIVTGAATVISAMGAGKAAAKSIHEYIMSKRANPDK
jgi:glutamate synthase (NADPH/NADH) small chain